MRFAVALPLALLAACAADPVLLPDSGPCSSACGAGTVCSAGACVSVDGGHADAGAATDVGKTFDAPAMSCVPACPAGMRCASGACVEFDAGPVADASADAADVAAPTDAMLAAFLRTCEGLGLPCGEGLTCSAYFADAGNRGTCNIACTTLADCARLLPDAGENRGLGCTAREPGLPKQCVIQCNPDSNPCPAGLGECRPSVLGSSRWFCAP